MPGLWSAAGIHCFITRRIAAVHQTLSRAYTLYMYAVHNGNAFNIQIQERRTIRHVGIYSFGDIDGGWLRGEVSHLRRPILIA
jgi:hypothetical protein